MATKLITPENILFVIGLLGTIFTAFSYFRDPQVKSEKVEAITALQVSGLQASVKTILENHLPHIDQRLNTMQSSFGSMSEKMVQLATIIDERIPKKQ